MRALVWVLVAAGPVAVSLGACGGNGTDGDADADADADADTDADADADGDADFDECVAVTETARGGLGPADVIFAIDNTPSMSDEIDEVRANMNRFSKMVVDRGLDLSITLVSCRTEECLIQDNWNTICIDPPVGAEGACASGADDTNLPGYLHVDQAVQSTKGFGRIVGTFDRWSSMIRDRSAKHVVLVSDDTDEWTAEQFDGAFRALDPRLEDYQFHAIFSFMSKDEACAIGASEPCCTYAAPGGEGVPYRELVAATGGVAGDLCLQDFDAVFDALGGAVLDSVTLSCEWEIPEPPEGETLDPGLVNVVFVDGEGEAHGIGRVDNAGLCDRVAQGWYYGEFVPPALPTTVFVCPQTCEWIQGRPGSRIDLQFGCETEMEPLI